jgi:hypothetical protein
VLESKEEIGWHPDLTSNSFPPSLKVAVVISLSQRLGLPSLANSSNAKKSFFLRNFLYFFWVWFVFFFIWGGGGATRTFVS